MNGFYNGIPRLIQIIERDKPKKILEYGTGLSTLIMSKMFEDEVEQIISVEYHWFWFLYNKVLLKLRNCKNVKLIYEPNIEKLKHFVDKHRNADFIFLDSPVNYRHRKRILDYILESYDIPVLVDDAHHVIPGNTKTHVTYNIK